MCDSSPRTATTARRSRRSVYVTHPSASASLLRVEERRYAIPAFPEPGERVLGEVLRVSPGAGDQAQPSEERYLVRHEEGLERPAEFRSGHVGLMHDGLGAFVHHKVNTSWPGIV
jgi:hypothetical protein